MNKEERQLFKLLDGKTKQKWKEFKKYYLNDSKPFINKIARDYPKAFPVHILKQIKKIDKRKYDSAACILRGALPYAILFESYGWKIHYLICGRKNEEVVYDKYKLRFNKNVDKTLKQIKGKKILIIENNSFSGNTPYRTVLELKKTFNIKKPDLFLDYLVKNNVFQKNKERINSFGKVFVASDLKVTKKERNSLLKEFILRLK